MTSKEYFETQEKSAEEFKNNNYDLVKKLCHKILINLDSIIKDMKETRSGFDKLYKPFIYNALSVAFSSDIDDLEKEIIKLLLSEKLITKKLLITHYKDFTFDNLKYAEQLFNFLFEEDLIDEMQKDKYIKNANKDIINREKRIEEIKILNSNIIEIIKSNPGILQKDIYKKFPKYDSSEMSSIIYDLNKENKIERIKSGNTYSLSIKSV